MAPWNPFHPPHKETFCRDQPITESLVCSSRRLVRLAFGDHCAYKEAPSRVLSNNRIHLPGVDVMCYPLLLAVIARILARRIPHQPQWSNATDLVRKDTAPAGAVPAHEHLNRKLNLRYDLFTSADYVACLLKHSGPAAVAEPSSLCNARSCTGFSDAG